MRWNGLLYCKSVKGKLGVTTSSMFFMSWTCFLWKGKVDNVFDALSSGLIARRWSSNFAEILSYLKKRNTRRISRVMFRISLQLSFPYFNSRSFTTWRGSRWSFKSVLYRFWSRLLTVSILQDFFFARIAEKVSRPIQTRSSSHETSLSYNYQIHSKLRLFYLSAVSVPVTVPVNSFYEIEAQAKLWASRNKQHPRIHIRAFVLAKWRLLSLLSSCNTFATRG